MFFDTWSGLGRTALVAVLGYASLILLLRVSGKRTLSKMNAFDLVVTVALGSTLATLILNASVPLVEGVLALAMLIGLQYAVAWSCVRSDVVEHVVKSRPTLVLYQGEFLDDALKRERLTRSEVIAAIRSRGYAHVEQVEAVVLETESELSVIASDSNGTALMNVEPPAARPH